MNKYTDTFSYLDEMEQLMSYTNRRNNLPIQVPRIILTNIKPHLTSSDLRTGQRYLFVQNLNSNSVYKFKAEFVDTVLNSAFGHMIRIKKVSKDKNGNPDENGTIIDDNEYDLSSKTLNAYLIKK